MDKAKLLTVLRCIEIVIEDSVAKCEFYSGLGCSCDSSPIGELTEAIERGDYDV